MTPYQCNTYIVHTTNQRTPMLTRIKMVKLGQSTRMKF